MSQSSFTVDDVRQVMDNQATELIFQLYNVLINRAVLLEASSDEVRAIRDGAIDAAVSLIHKSGITDPQDPLYDGLTQTLLECVFMNDFAFMDRLVQKRIIT